MAQVSSPDDSAKWKAHLAVGVIGLPRRKVDPVIPKAIHGKVLQQKDGSKLETLTFWLSFKHIASNVPSRQWKPCKSR